MLSQEEKLRLGWVVFDLVRQQSNRDAVGARIRVRIGDAWQTRVVSAGSGRPSGNSRRRHFGLGDARRIDAVENRWPSGWRIRLRDLEASRSHRIEEAVEVAADGP